MEYPLFSVPALGGGMLVAVVAIVHVVIAHFAVGAGLYLAIMHTWALRRDDRLLLRYLKDHSQFLVLFAFVAGAVTGVGIWVTIGLVSPPATSRLIHHFVWGWAAEWCFFAIEIVAGYVYYYGWGRLAPRRHVAVAWIYAVSAFMSLFLINGIISAMLTTGGWGRMLRGELPFSADGAFWLGFFNETFWPSLILRTISCLSLAAIFVAVIVNLRRGYTREERREIINRGAYFMMPLALMAPVGVWYFLELPGDVRELPTGGAIAMTLFLGFGVAASMLIGGYAYFGLLRSKRYINAETSLLLLAIAFIATGSMEFVREGIRKPYLIYGVMYSNGIPATAEWQRKLNSDGILQHAAFVRPPGLPIEQVRAMPALEVGRMVFEAQCRICHEAERGTNALEPLVRDKSREWLETTTRELHRVRYFMPPFMGNEAELQAIVDFQYALGHGKWTETDAADTLAAAVSRLKAPKDATGAVPHTTGDPIGGASAFVGGASASGRCDSNDSQSRDAHSHRRGADVPRAVNPDPRAVATGKISEEDAR